MPTQPTIYPRFAPPKSTEVRLPIWMRNKAIIAYFAAFLLVSLSMRGFAMRWYYILSGMVTLLLFFYYGWLLSNRWSAERVRMGKGFEKKVFWLAFSFRALWMVAILYIFKRTYGNEFGFDAADATLYQDLGERVADMIRRGDFHFYNNLRYDVDLSDMGYGIYIGFVYFLTNNSIFILRLLKCVWSSLTVVLIYRLARRNFDESTARMAALYCALWPNFWYYCGVHLKEVEMVFLSVLFVEQGDQMLRTRNFSGWKVLPLLAISGALFTIRTPLALVSVLALLFTIVMSSTRVVNWGKRILIGVLALGLVGVTMGNRIEEQSRHLMEAVQGNQQQGNMEWRSKRAGGNQFAKYVSTSVFAPLIFTIPFPTMVDPTGGQHVQSLLNGGNFTKNVLSGFTIFAMFSLLFSGKWREHLLPLSFTLGYLVVLTMSSFPHSERFHQPTMPFEMMFSAYGLGQVLRGVPIFRGVGNAQMYKRWFGYWILVCFVAAVAWNWFKLAGRGLL